VNWGSHGLETGKGMVGPAPFASGEDISRGKNGLNAYRKSTDEATGPE